MKSCAFILLSAFLTISIHAQQITLQPQAGNMACSVRVPDLPRQSFILGLPETIGCSEGMILNFPEVSIVWEGPDAQGVVRHTWTSAGKVAYSLELIPGKDYVDARMSIRNLGRSAWTNVFSFNCLNPAGAQQFQDWTLERTYMSKNGRPFRMDSTVRVNNGSMSTVQFYLNDDYASVSPFIQGFKATSPDRTDASYIVTLSEDGTAYMAASSPRSSFLFDNLDRCCIHSATDFGTILPGGETTVVSRFYFAQGGLQDFLTRFENDHDRESAASPRVAMCYGNPWVLADTTQWSEVLERLDILKIYIGNIDARVDPEQARAFIQALLAHDIRIAVELGGLLDWHAAKGSGTALASFQQDFSNVKPLIDLIKSVDPSRSIDMLDMDGPIRRMLHPSNSLPTVHTLETAVDELAKVVRMWRDSIPGIEINLLTNFPNWSWNGTPAYYAISGSSNGYGKYEEVLDAIEGEGSVSGLYFDGVTVDNPYDYATGRAQSNQAALIVGVDWMRRLAELQQRVRQLGWKVNMIFNTNGGRTAAGYSEQTLALIDLYHDRVGIPDGYWIQSWYQLPGDWLPETTPGTMTHLTLAAMKRIVPGRALLEPEDGRVYHGVQTLTFTSEPEPLAGYRSALNDESIQPAVRGLFFSIPGTRGPAQSLRQLGEFFHSADSIGFIPELSLFLTSDVATDSIIAVTDQYDHIIDSIITLSKAYGRAMFLRIGGEFNGVWNGYHPYLYVDMFRKITDSFAARGFRDSIATIWCYMPAAGNDFDSTDGNGALWYPGDNYVDWFGLDVFDVENFDEDAPREDRRGITTKGKTERFLEMARLKGKPVYMSETSAIRINISSDPADGIEDWNDWFAKFWTFIDAHQEIKGFSYIDADWPEHAYPDWGDARIENSDYVSTRYREEMHRAKYIHLPWSGTSSTGFTAANPAGIMLEQNSPNPFRTETNIRVVLDRSASLRLSVIDMLGREMQVLAEGQFDRGIHAFRLRSAGMPPGVYLYRLHSTGGMLQRKMILH